MGLDIRFPLGLIFAITGAMLTIYGIVTLHSPIYNISEGININLYWGLLMLLFGLIMTYAGRKRSS